MSFWRRIPLAALYVLIVLMFAAPSGAAPSREELDSAFRSDNVEEIKRILKENPELINQPVNEMSGNYPVHEAASDKNTELVVFLAVNGADLDVKDKGGDTSLQMAVNTDTVEVVRTLLEHGANPNIGGNDGETPLHRAASKGNVEVARLLIEGGAEIDAATDSGATPLLRASTNARVEVVKLLLENGADPNAQTKWGVTPLKEAQTALIQERQTQYAEISKLLIKAGANEGTPAKGVEPDVEPAAAAKALAKEKAGEPEATTQEPARSPKPEKARRKIARKKVRSTKPYPVPKVVPDPGTKAFRSDPDLEKISIQVVAGDGNMDAARVLMRKIFSLGYMVDWIISAPGNYKTTTVYYNEGFKEVAETLAEKLGEGVEVKPRTKPAKFDLVVVSVKK